MTFAVFVVYGLFAASVRDHIVSRPRVLTWMRRTSPRFGRARRQAGFSPTGKKVDFDCQWSCRPKIKNDGGGNAFCNVAGNCGAWFCSRRSGARGKTSKIGFMVPLSGRTPILAPSRQGDRLYMKLHAKDIAPYHGRRLSTRRRGRRRAPMPRRWPPNSSRATRSISYSALCSRRRQSLWRRS